MVNVRTDFNALKQQSGSANLWLGWQDSNLRMPVPKTGALPLGYTPARAALYSAVFSVVKGSNSRISPLRQFILDLGNQLAIEPIERHRHPCG